MARCEQGYLCQVCGDDVEAITESELYLRYVAGLVDPEQLHTLPERHLRCTPVVAQFIVDERFEPVVVEGEFDKRRLDSDYVARREALFSRAWRRLHEILELPGLSVHDYPLEEVRAAMQTRWGR